MSDGDNLRTFPVPEHPVIHLRRPGDAVTLVFAPEPLAEQPAPYPAELLLPCRLRVTGSMAVYDAPDGQIIRQASMGGQIDVYEQRGAWWRVTQPPVREMWVKAARLVE